MTQRAWLLGLVCTCVAIVGCGDDDGGSGSGGGPTVAELPEDIAGSICDAFIECFGAASEVVINRADCVTTQVAAIQDSEFRYIENAIDAGRISYHAERVDACLAEIGGASCVELDTGSLATECEDVFVGTLAIGELCGINEECESGSFCRLTAACPGTCTALGDEGDACENNDECGETLSCTGGVCGMPLVAGDACGTTLGTCSLGLLCAGAEGTTPGTCEPYADRFTRAEGATCSPTTLELCEAGLVCAATLNGTELTFACEDKVAAGAACKVAYPDQCPSGQYCEATGFAGTCTALPGDGEPCVGSDDDTCAPRHICTAGMCHAVNRIGGACTTDEHCASESCVSGACAAPLECDPAG